jgi:hypothetical protein
LYGLLVVVRARFGVGCLEERQFGVKKDWVLDQPDFDRLLEWLDDDREIAGEKYEIIRRNLIKIFNCRASPNPEELADETINRVASRVALVAPDYTGDPCNYFYGVAKIVYLECMKARPVLVAPLAPTSEEEQRAEQVLYDCLENCIRVLDAGSRNLVLEYYVGEKRDRIEQRKKLAKRLGITPAVLRLKAYRIRLGLHKCVGGCVRRQHSH